MAEHVHICAIFKDEALYLKEWLELHMIVGVERFVLYQNNSTDNYRTILDPYIEQGIVELTEWPMRNPSQLPAYADCIRRYGGQHIWMCFIDIDEFLFSPQFDTVPLALEFLLASGVPRSAFGINWMVFGSGGQTEYEDRPVTERFVWRPVTSHLVDQHIKSVVWMDQQVSTGNDPHFFRVERGIFNEKGNPICGPFSPHSSEVLRINHYSSKSLAEWCKRILLGKPDRSGVEVREQDWYWDRQAMDVCDKGIQKFLPQLKGRLAK